MKTRYSNSLGVFYPYDLTYPELPNDLIEVDITDYQAAISRPDGSTFSFEPGGVLTIFPAATPSLDDLKAKAIYSMNAKAEAIAAQLTAGYPEFEMKTWPDQQAEALAWNADNTAATPRIDAMAGYRGIDRITYLQKTVAKVIAFQKASDYLVGTRQAYVDQITAASEDELKTIVPIFTLPS